MRPKAPVFEHRHYVGIAAILANIPRGELFDAEAIALHFANALQGTNPRYDRTRFLAAANGQPQNGKDQPR